MTTSDQSPLAMLVQQLQQELQNQRTEMQSLRADLTASQNHVRELTQLFQTGILSAPAPSTRSRLPDPPRFDGKSLTLRTWLPSIRAKLRSDQLAGADAFDYVWDRLEQPQQASVLHLRQSAEDAQLWDPEAIFSFFLRLCHNPREQQEAILRFSSVRQRDEESLIAYLARFERLAYEAKATSWPDLSRITAFHRGLRPPLRQHLEESHDSLFQTQYSEYIELVQSFDRRQRRPYQNQNQNQNQNHRKPAASADAMDIDPVHAAAGRPIAASPYPIDEVRPIRAALARPLSPASSTSTRSNSASARRTIRTKENLCFCCGSDSHWIAQCPLATRSQSRSLSPRGGGM